MHYAKVSTLTVWDSWVWARSCRETISLITCSTAATAERAVPRSQTLSWRSARPGWIKFRKSFASRACQAVSALITSPSAATSINRWRSHFSRFVGGFLTPAFLTALAIAVSRFSSSCRCNTHRSNASRIEPARTVAALHSPLDKALFIALISMRRFSRIAWSSIKLNSAVSDEGNSSGQSSKT